MGLAFVYLACVLLAAFYGRRLAVGFWGSLLLAIFITPLLFLIIAGLFRPREKATPKSA